MKVFFSALALIVSASAFAAVPSALTAQIARVLVNNPDIVAQLHANQSANLIDAEVTEVKPGVFQYYLVFNRQCECVQSTASVSILEDMTPTYSDGSIKYTTSIAISTEVPETVKLVCELSAVADKGYKIEFIGPKGIDGIFQANAKSITIAGMTPIASLICHQFPRQSEGADRIEITHTCREPRLMDAGYSVTLRSGGITGVPQAQLNQVTFEGETPIAIMSCRVQP